MTKQIRRKTERTSVDPVTHQFVRVVLDAAQLASERVWRVVDGAACRVPPAQSLAEYRVAVVALRTALVAVEGGADPGASPVPKAVAREWAKLDMPGRTRFAALLRERAALVVEPDTGAV